MRKPKVKYCLQRNWMGYYESGKKNIVLHFVSLLFNCRAISK